PLKAKADTKYWSYTSYESARSKDSLRARLRGNEAHIAVRKQVIDYFRHRARRKHVSKGHEYGRRVPSHILQCVARLRRVDFFKQKSRVQLARGGRMLEHIEQYCGILSVIPNLIRRQLASRMHFAAGLFCLELHRSAKDNQIVCLPMRAIC